MSEHGRDQVSCSVMGGFHLREVWRKVKVYSDNYLTNFLEYKNDYYINKLIVFTKNVSNRKLNQFFRFGLKRYDCNFSWLKYSKLDCSQILQFFEHFNHLLNINSISNTSISLGCTMTGQNMFILFKWESIFNRKSIIGPKIICSFQSRGVFTLGRERIMYFFVIGL